MAFKLKEGGLLDRLTGGPKRRRDRRSQTGTPRETPQVAVVPEPALTEQYVQDVAKRAKDGDPEARKKLGELQGQANVEDGTTLKGWLYKAGQRASGDGRITL